MSRSECFLTLLCLFVICSHAGSQIYVLNGTDPEGDPVRYGLTFEKGSKVYFRVEPKSGNVTLTQELDREVRPMETDAPASEICHHWHQK